MRDWKFLMLVARCLTFLAALLPGLAFAQPMTIDEFRRELVGVPLCGTPEAGSSPARCCARCTCRTAPRSWRAPASWSTGCGRRSAAGLPRNAHDPADKRRCVSYERVDRSHFRNSDGVGFCLGPCESERQ